MRVDPNQKLRHIVSGLLCSLTEKLDMRDKLIGTSSNDRQSQRKIKCCSPCNGFRCAADGDPDRQLLVERTRVDAEIIYRRPMFSLPGHSFTFINSKKQFKFLGEQ